MVNFRSGSNGPTTARVSGRDDRSFASDCTSAAVTVADVQAVAADLAARPRSLAVVGPFDEDRSFGL